MGGSGRGGCSWGGLHLGRLLQRGVGGLPLVRDKQKLSEPDKQKLSEHNKQILEQERIEKCLHELKRARLEREKLEREREKITRLKKNAIKIESKSETKVRVPQLAS